MAETLYKVLMNGRSCHGGDFKWSLPKGKKPGKWHKIDGDIKICERGLHLTPKPYEWFKWGCDIYRAEYRGDVAWSHDKSKCTVSEARLISKESKPEWLIGAERFVESLKTTKFWFSQRGERLPEWRYFEGGTLAAARAAAWDAARAAARAAAGDAAWYAARDAARAAARAAAGDAAWYAARDAARDAARAAAGAAARDAARDAALFVQTNYICTGLKLDKKHIDHAAARWEVWKRGYSLLCDVNGVLYVCGVKKWETGK